MEKVTITIETVNSAFEDHPNGTNGEVARILRDLADRFEGGEPIIVRDANGNKVGVVEVK